MSNKICNERKCIYYFGLFLMILEFILVKSSFFMTDTPRGFNSMNFGPPPFFKRAIIGMICLVVGIIITRVGAHGAAGYGLVLDPEKARQDLKHNIASQIC